MKAKNFFYGLAAILLFHSCRKNTTHSEPETLRVSIEEVSYNKVPLQVPYVGIIEEDQRTMVSFTNMAVLKRITIAEGEHVVKGQLLATIDDTQARHALTAAQSALDQAQDARERMKKLHDSESLPEMKWIEIESKVKQAQATYDMCKKNLDDCAIYAPCNGVIGNKVMNVGETVLPSEPVLNILSINKVKVRVSIPEKEISSIYPNTPSRIILDAVPGETFNGGKIEKGVSADAITHTYDIRISLDNPKEQLLPGMVAKVHIMKNEGERHITLPIKAVQQASNKDLFVWVVEDGKAQRRNVTINQNIGNRVMIESGLEEGEKVIVEGYQKVGKGTPVIF